MRERIHRLAGLKSNALDYFLVIFLMGFFYRISLYYQLYTAEVAPLDFSPDNISLLQLIGQIGWEVVFAGICALVYYGCSRLGQKLSPVSRRLGSAVMVLFAMFFLVLLAVYYASHLRLIFSMHIGVTRDSLRELVDDFSVTYLIRLMTIGEMIMVLLPVAAFWAIHFARGRSLQVKNLAGLGSAAAVLLILSTGLIWPVSLAPELKFNPVIFTTLEAFQGTPVALNEGGRATARQLKSVALIDPLFRRDAVQAARPVQKKTHKKYNIIFIILESTGDRYVFDTSLGTEMPMPFLHELSTKSLFLTNHYSPSNSSPHSVFALLSGLYPSPTPEFFSMRKDNHVPSIQKYLGSEYDSFLVTPATLDWYFPRAFLQHSGLQEMYGFYNLPRKKLKPAWKLGRHETDVMDVFIARMKKSLGNPEKPFLGIYITFAPHWPYFEFEGGPDIFPPGAAKVHGWKRKYYNSLRLQDREIARIYRELEKSGHLKDTILVIAGDHSEAFGQHKGNWTHSRASYEENVKVPALIYQPELFPARKVTEATSHVDITPTLLDAMGSDFNPLLFQGESLVHPELLRKYLFVYGNEDALSAVGSDRTKVQVSFKTSRCRAFDLNRDPGEQKELNCAAYPDQKKAVLQFRNLQPEILRTYSNAIRQGGATLSR